MDVQPAADALRTALLHDPSLPGEPARLGRALTDLLPQAERTVLLLVTAATSGVPALLAEGHRTEARNRLVDHAGMRGDLAEQVVSAWLSAAHPVGADPVTAGPAPITSEEPGPAIAVAVGTGQTDEPVVGLVTGTGVYVGDTGAWRRVADAPAATSRDVAVAGRHIVWTGPGGVFAREVADASLGERRTVAAAGEARYPLAAVCADGESVDVLWTADRISVRHAALRGWQSRSALAVPAAPAGERLTALAAAPADGRTVWLVALTEAGTLGYARWDLSTSGVGDWTPAPPPARLATIALAGTLVLGYTTAGHLLAYDIGGVKAWRSVDPPPGSARPRRAPHAMAATPDLLLVAEAEGTWLSAVDRTDDVPRLGAARRLGH